MSHLVFSIGQNPKEVGSDAREGMDLPVRVRTGRQREQALLPRPYIGCQQKAGPTLKVNLPTPKI